uniref:Uncharacterized protein n=1 Tax=Pavo cristatus TaxID=9049 RepID=A0A8C9EIY7_PAVCR
MKTFILFTVVIFCLASQRNANKKNATGSPEAVLPGLMYGAALFVFLLSTEHPQIFVLQECRSLVFREGR